jgi:hypothetical protein
MQFLTTLLTLEGLGSTYVLAWVARGGGDSWEEEFDPTGRRDGSDRGDARAISSMIRT